MPAVRSPIGDEGHIGGEDALLAVKGRELLAVGGGAHHDAALAVALDELAEVEGVERLAGEEHHVVGDVDDVVDGTAARCDDALGEPFGAGRDLDAADHAGDVAAAEAGVGDLDRDELGGIGALLVLHGGQHDVGILVEHGAHLDGHADHREAVRAVGRDLAVDHGIGEALVIGEIDTHRSVLGQLDDAAVVVIEAELAAGAAHAEAVIAAELALLDLEVARQHGADHGDDHVQAGAHVGSAADDLQGLGRAVGAEVALADAHLAEPHVVGIGMRHRLDHVAGHDVLEIGADLLDGLDLGSRADELLDEVGRALGHIDHRLQPFI